jgi:hypothetical protein
MAMILKILPVVFLVLMVPFYAMADVGIDISLTWDPVWEYEDGTLAERPNLAHFNVYVCDAPIVAGGPNANNVRVEPATCVGVLKVIEATSETTEATYTAPNQSGNLYFRVSAVTVHGTESLLSNELKHPYSFQRFKAPINLRVTVKEQIP